MGVDDHTSRDLEAYGDTYIFDPCLSDHQRPFPSTISCHAKSAPHTNAFNTSNPAHLQAHAMG